MFLDYNRPNAPSGIHTYTVDVQKSGFPNAFAAKDLFVDVEEQANTIQIRNALVSPSRFIPGLGPIKVNYELTADAVLAVRVRDSQGKVVRVIAGPNAKRLAGLNSEVWDGKDASGNAVPIGSYSVSIFARSDIGSTGDGVLYSPLEFATQGQQSSEISEANDLIYDAFNDQVVVAGYANDANYKIARYSPAGTFRGNFALCGGQGRPVAITQDTKGFFYVQDDLGKLFKFDKASFACLGQIGDTRSESREASLSASGAQYVYALDNTFGPRSVIRFGLDGSATKSVSMPDLSSGNGDGLALDRNGDVWVIYTQNPFLGKIYHYDKDLNLLGTIDSGFQQRGLDVDIKHGALLYVVTRANNVIKVYDIENESWLPDLPLPSLNGTTGGSVSGVDAVENGFTYVLGDLRNENPTPVRQVVRYRDRLSAHFQTIDIKTKSQDDVNAPPNTVALGPNGQTISEDTATITVFGSDDDTSTDKLEYARNLNNQGWSAYSTNSVITVSGIGRGTNTLSVRSRDSAGVVDDTPAVVTFIGTVDHPPERPVNLYPFNGQSNVALPISLIGSAFIDPDPASTFARAQFQMRTENGIYGEPQEITPASSVTQNLSGTLQSSTNHWWQIRYADDSGRWSEWSAETAFTSASQPNGVVKGDFNADNWADIVFQDTSSFLAAWFMNGASMTNASYLVPSNAGDTNWRIVGSGDFNGDGLEDLVFQHTDGTLAVWFMKGIAMQSAVLINPKNPGDRNWIVVATGDLNKDGQTDLLFQHTDGTLAVWFMNGINLASASLISPSQPGNGWKVVGTGDFNRDGNDDLVFQHSDGTIAVWFMNGGTMTQATETNPPRPDPDAKRWHVVSTVDRNQDGKPDLLFQHEDGTLAVWFMDGITLKTASLLNPSKPGGTWKVVAPR